MSTLPAMLVVTMVTERYGQLRVIRLGDIRLGLGGVLITPTLKPSHVARRGVVNMNKKALMAQ